MRPVGVGAIIGAGLLLLGGALLGASAVTYLGSPEPLDSFSGSVVFTVNGQLVQYSPWIPDTLAVLLLAAGLVMLVASLVLTAVVWGPRRERVY